MRTVEQLFTYSIKTSIMVSRKRQILRSMAKGVKEGKTPRNECNVVFCNNTAMSPFACNHSVCGHCLLNIICVYEGDDNDEYMYTCECPICRHCFNVCENTVKELLHNFGKDFKHEAQCACKSCSSGFVLQLLPCKEGCMDCVGSSISHTKFFEVTSDDENSDMDDDSEMMEGPTSNVVILNENGDGEITQRLLGM